MQPLRRHGDMGQRTIFQDQANWQENIAKHPWSGSEENIHSSKKLSQLLTQQGGLDSAFQKWALKGQGPCAKNLGSNRCSSDISSTLGSGSSRFSPGGVYTAIVMIEASKLNGIISEIKNLRARESNKHTLGIAWLEKKVERFKTSSDTSDPPGTVRLMYTGYSCDVARRMKEEFQYKSGGGNAQLVNLFWEAVRTKAPDAWKDRVCCNLVSGRLPVWMIKP
jgi:hypothetical protein